MKIQKKHITNKTRDLFLNKKRNYLVLTQIINASVGLVSGKLIAEFILPEQFGLYNLQFAAFTLFFSLLIGPSITFMKASYQELVPKLGYKLFFLTLGALAAIMGIVLLVFYNFYFNESIFNSYLFIAILLVIPINIMTSIAYDQFNVLDKINLFSTLSILKAFVGLFFLFVTFYIFKQVYNGYEILWGMQLVMGLTGTAFFILKLKRFPNEKRISTRNFLKKHLHFTLPLMVLAFWSWINNYFDRYAIEAFMSLKDVGIYNANYGLGSKFFLMLSPIFMVLLTPFVYQDNNIELKKKLIDKYVLSYFLMGILILLALYFLTDFVGSVLLAETYSSGFYIIFWVALAFMIMTGTYLYESIFYAQHNTKIILYSNVLSALINMSLNLLLIPLFGLNGAIIALLTSVLIRLCFVYFKYRRV